MARRTRTADQDVSPFNRKPFVAPPNSGHPTGYNTYSGHPQSSMSYRSQPQYPSPYAPVIPEDAMVEKTAETRRNEVQAETYPGHDKRRKEKRRRRRIPLWALLLMIIGLVTVLVVLGRRVIVPLLVYANTLGGGAV